MRDEAVKLLFVCSRNQWRSRTAEEIFRGRPGIVARSGGTEASARVRVSEGMIGWADVVLVMERKHAAILRERFPEAMTGKRVECLGIEDEYGFMDEDLIAMLEAAVEEWV